MHNEYTSAKLYFTVFYYLTSSSGYFRCILIDRYLYRYVSTYVYEQQHASNVWTSAHFTCSNYSVPPPLYCLCSMQWNCSNIESRECEFCFYLSIECVFYIVSPMTHRLLFILENVGGALGCTRVGGTSNYLFISFSGQKL